MDKGSKFGAKPKGTAKHKGAKGRRGKNKNKIKTKARTANKRVDRRQQNVAMAKATQTNSAYRNKGRREAAPATTSDAEQV